MAFIVSAIQGLGCPTVILDKGIRTDYDVDGDPDAPMVNGNQINFEANSSEDVTTVQSVTFAICGVSKFSFSYDGLIEKTDPGFDRLLVAVTGIEVNFEYLRESQGGGEPDEYESVEGSGEVDLDNDNPCGYLVSLSFNTGDGLYNDGVFYTVDLSYE